MHKLNLDQVSPITPAVTQTAVDAPTMVSDNQTSETLVSTRGKSMPNSSSKSKLLFLVLAIGLGVVTGFGAHKLRAGSTSETYQGDIQRHPGESIDAGDVFGSADENIFKDNAEGYLEIGGIDGEGSHRLSRAGGDSQTVYMTSSVVDLDEYEGMDVKVWGETYKGQVAGWLMDVGRVQILNPQGSAPSEE